MRASAAALQFGDRDWSQPLRPDEYALLARRRKVGGVPQRDVAAFRQLCDRVDRDGTGEITMASFVAEIEAGAAGMTHMRRTLEGAFRSADLNGDGTLTLWEFARVMLPRASPRQLNEILAFVTYDGPAADADGGRPRKLAAETVAQLRQLVELYDTDGSGSIDRDELRTALAAILATIHGDADGGGGGDAVAAEAATAAARRQEAFFASMDQTGDGAVDFVEFCAVMGAWWAYEFRVHANDGPMGT